MEPINDMDPIELNVQGVSSLIRSGVNKTSGGPVENAEGVESEKIDALDLPMSDDDLLKLSRKWEIIYSPYGAKIETKQKISKAYYLGLQEAGSPKANTYQTPIADNLIFEAAETFVPATLAKNPEPVVFTDDTSDGEKVSDAVKTVLQYHADTLNLRGQCTLVVRKWLVDYLGVIKHGWDYELSDIWDDVRDAKDFIFDPEGYVDMSGDFIGWLGERITVTAERLIEIFPKHQVYISILVNGNLGTKCTYTEWWNDDYTFTTFKDKVLDKSKNPNYNYGTKDTPGLNHYGRPKKPYTFFSVFSFGDQPHDVTSLIEQNIANQKVISRRSDQIDFNLSRQNNSDIFSGDNWTQETAKQASRAIKEGHPVIVPPGGPINNSIVRLQAHSLDNGFFNDLQARKQALRSSFGTEGITAQPPQRNELATGILLNKEHDTSRISGGIGDALERFVKGVFNQHVQFYYVYYDIPHYGMILGKMNAVQYQTLQQSDFETSDGKPRRLVVSVSPDSMKPHDEITEMNQAMQLWKDGALDPKTLLIRTKFPDPDKTAAQVVLWHLDPMAYAQQNFPEVAQMLQQAQQGKQDPKAIEAQAKVQSKAEETKMDIESKRLDMQLDAQKAQQDMAIKAAEAHQKLQLEHEANEQKARHAEESHRSKQDESKKKALQSKETKHEGKTRST